MTLPHRLPAPKLRGFDYASPRAYFITICTSNRRRVLSTIHADEVALTEVGSLVERHWLDLPTRHPGLRLDTHVLMPDHLHAVLWLPEPGTPLSRIIGLFKAGCARDLRSIEGTRKEVWQRGFYDRVIRSERELDALRQYITDNPRRWSQGP